jgi:hypothetical protein
MKRDEKAAILRIKEEEKALRHDDEGEAAGSWRAAQPRPCAASRVATCPRGRVSHRHQQTLVCCTCGTTRLRSISQSGTVWSLFCLVYDYWEFLLHQLHVITHNRSDTLWEMRCLDKNTSCSPRWNQTDRAHQML